MKKILSIAMLLMLVSCSDYATTIPVDIMNEPVQRCSTNEGVRYVQLSQKIGNVNKTVPHKWITRVKCNNDAVFNITIKRDQ